MVMIIKQVSPCSSLLREMDIGGKYGEANRFRIIGRRNVKGARRWLVFDKFGLISRGMCRVNLYRGNIEGIPEQWERWFHFLLALIDTAAVLKKEIRVVSRAKFCLAHLSFPFTDSWYLRGEEGVRGYVTRGRICSYLIYWKLIRFA